MRIYDWRQVPRALSPGQEPKDIPFTEHEFVEKWAKKASEEFGEDGLVIEIGSYKGCSTVILAQFFTVLAIDLWYPLEDYRAATIGKNFDNFMDTYRKFKLKGRVIPLLGSTTYLRGTIPNLNVGFCFIDGDHSYEGTMSDLLFCNSHLSPRGYLVIHDYPRAGTIKKAVDEFIKDYHYTVQEICGDGAVALRKGNGL
jgi:hypothetical protein